MKLYRLFQTSNLLKVYAVRENNNFSFLWTLNKNVASKFSEKEVLHIIQLYKNNHHLVLKKEEIL